MSRKKTAVNATAPHNVNDAAHQIGCAPNTLRDYIKRGLVQVPRTTSGHAILFEPQIEQARTIFVRNKRI
jgi:predicted site-specific integrase-resolvase